MAVLVALVLLAAPAIGAVAADHGPAEAGPSNSDDQEGLVDTNAETAAASAATQTAAESDPATDASEPASFGIVATDVPRTADAGDRITVNAIVENTGDERDDQTVAFVVDGTVLEERSLELGPGETHTVTFSYQTGADDVGALDLAIETEDVVDERTVTVERSTEPASFDVEIEEAPGAITAGESIDVDATVENVGGQAAEQTVEFTVAGSVEDDATLTLDSGEAETVSFGFETASNASGVHEIEVASANASDTTVVDVQQPAQFDVEITDAPDRVVVGDTVQIEALVENEGDRPGEQAIEFAIGDGFDGRVVHTVGGGDARQISLNYTTDEDDLGTLSTSVESEDDSAEHAVTVGASPAPASFDVEITEAPTSVTAGATIDVEATVENDGEDAAEQRVEFVVDGEVVDSEAVHLDGGEHKAVQFSYDTDESQEGDLELVVESEQDSEEHVVEIDQSTEVAPFDVEITDAPESVPVGETVEVDVAVENTGDVADSQELRFLRSGEPIAAEPIELEAGESTTHTFEYITSETDGVDLDLVVGSDTDSDGTIVEIDQSTEPAPFDVEITDAPESVQVGDTAEVDVTVANTGEAGDSQELRFLLSGELVDTASIELEAEESTTHTFEYATSESDGVDLDLVVGSETDSDGTIVGLDQSTEAAPFDVEITDAPASVAVGDTAEIDVTVENTGDEAESQELRFLLSGEPIAAEPIELEAGESTTHTFEYETSETDGVDLDLVVGSDTDSDGTIVELDEPPASSSFDVDVTDAPESVEVGDAAAVDVAVENTGDEADSQELRLLLSGERVGSEPIELDAGESTTHTFEYTPDEDDGVDLDLVVGSDTDSDGTIVEIDQSTEPAHFEVDVTDAPESVGVGDAAEVEVTVQNTGDGAAEQQLRLLLSGDRIDAAPIELEAGESTTHTFEYTPDEDDGVDLDLVVGSDTDSDGTIVGLESDASETDAETDSETDAATHSAPDATTDAATDAAADATTTQTVHYGTAEFRSTIGLLSAPVAPSPIQVVWDETAVTGAFSTAP